jgi:hypothetical protein
MIHPHVQLVLPAGFDGAIVKPLDWRRWNDSERFIRDWLEFIRPIKIYRRARMAVRLARWEREKDFIRRWWFDLPRYERHCWIGRRADGEFPNIMLAAGFKGPKYQRGNFAIFPAGTTALADGGATLELNSANNDATNVDISPPGALDAGFGLFRAGTHFRTNSAGTNQINSGTDWITPRDSTVGDDYEVKWNLTIGSALRINDESYTEDTWVTLNVSTGRGRYVGKSTSAPSIIDQFEIDIGDVSTSTSDVNQNYSVEAGDLI